MKKIYLLIFSFLTTLTTFAQQKGINYQAVILDPKAIDVPGVAITGQPLANGTVCIKFSIGNGSQTEYEEIQQTKTDEYGLINLTIGAGNGSGNGKVKTFDAITWSAKPFLLTVSVSFDNCLQFKQVSTQAFNYTPYAFYAEAVEYANVRNAPKNLSEFNNDVGYITKKALVPLSDSLRNLSQETAQKFLVVNQEIASIQSNIATIKTDIGGLRNDVNGLRIDVNNSKNEINSLWSNVGGLQGSVNSLRNDVNTHSTQISQLFNSANNNDNRINGISADLSSKAPINSPVFTGTPVLPASTVAATQGANDHSTAIATTAFVQNAIAAGVMDASATQKGKIKLSGDLAGTADAPTVPGLSLKENGANKSSDPNLGTSNELYPTQNAVKTFVENKILNATLADASNSSKGKIQLGGDIAGSNDAAAPLITPGAVSTAKIADGAITGAKIANGAVSANNIANGAVTNAKIGEPISVANGGTGASNLAQALSNLGAEPSINKTTSVVSDGNSDVKFPSAKAVKDYVDQSISSSVPNASNTSLGKIQLAGDIAGSNDATAPMITPGAVTASKIADGAIVNAKIAIGAVTNASIADGAITNTKIGEVLSISNGGTGASTATAALSTLGGESSLNKSTNLAVDGTTDSKYPSTKAVKSYVDTQLATAIANGAPDATTATTGKVQLAGDLGGAGTTAAAPIISSNAINADKLANNAVTTDKIVNASVTDAKIVGISGSKVSGDISGKASNVTDVVDVSHGGTGNAATLTGYVKGNGTQAMTASASIPLTDVPEAQAISNLKTATDLGGLSASDVYYPSQKAVKAYVDALNNSGVGGATQNSLNLKEDVANKSTDPLLGTSNSLYPSQSAVKLYVDNKLASNQVIQNLNGLPLISNNTILGNTSGASHAPIEIPTTGTGNAVLANNANLSSPTITNVAINGNITGTAIVPVSQGGSGANMSNTVGYLKQNITGANFTTIEKIPVTDIDQAVRTVNGVQPDANGNVPLTIGRVTTGTLAARPTTSANNGDFYVVSNDGTNNGLTYVWDGTAWQEVTPNQAATDARYVNATGDVMQGDLTIPTGKKLLLADAPASATEAANKSYVDNQIVAATPNATTSFTGKIQLAGDLSGTATAPVIGSNKISFDKMQQVGANVVLGATTAGNIQALGTIPLATIPAFTGDVDIAAGSNQTSIVNKKVTYAKIQDLSGQNKLLGSGQNSGLTVTEISIGNGLTMNGNTLESSGVWNGATVQVPFGGTGATSLTGYVKGNGTNPMSASSTIPVADVVNAETNLNKSTAVDLGGNAPSDVMYPSQKAAKTYIDNAVSSAIASGAPDATTLATGKVQLAGDLAGAGTTATAPVIAAGAINSIKLADNAVVTSKIVDATVTESKLANASVSTIKLQDASVSTAKIAAGAVTNVKIAADAITTDKILDGEVQTVDLANNAVTSAKIATGAITNTQIAAGAVKNNSIGEAISIANGGTGATNAADARTNLGAESVANKVTNFSSPSNDTYPSSLAVQNLVAAATADATTSSKGIVQLSGDLSGTAAAPVIADGKITSTKIADGTIVSTDIAAGGVSSANIANNAIVNPLIANNAVTSNKILDGDVQTIDLANNAVTTAKLADLALTNSKIAAGAITDDKISGPISLTNGGTGANNALDARTNLGAEFVGNKAVDFSITDNTKYPTTQAVSAYVSSAISASVVPATTTTYGTIKLAGDLTGDAATPTVSDNAITTAKISNGAITNAKIGQTITVANGGTGATSLTGYIKGNGGAAMTASASIPVADVVDAQQRSNLTTDILTDAASDVKYPSAKAVDTYFTNHFLATNGTTVTAGKVELGGNLTKATTLITTASNTLAVSGLQTGSEDHNTVVVDANGVLKTLPPSQRLKSQIISVNTNYTVVATDYTILASAATGDILLTLPSPASNVGRFLIIRKTDETTNKLSFDSAIKISETSSFQDINMNVTIRIQSDGTSWYKID